MVDAGPLSGRSMSDRTDTIHSLQRAARSEGRREAALRVREPRPERRGPIPAGVRRGAVAARDFGHFWALRAGEAFLSLPERTRRIAVGTTSVSALLLVVVLTATAGADGDDRAGAGAGAVVGDGATATRAPRGTAADETLIGTQRTDRINGRAGDDVVLAGDGDDVVGGATGDDVLHGAAGDDVLFAGPGRDVLIGAAGDDQLRATNLDGQRDRLHCGEGDDVAWVVARNGRVEDLTTGCERVNVIDVRVPRRAR